MDVRSVAILLEKFEDTDDAFSQCKRIMEPVHNRTAVIVYEEECVCIGEEAEHDANLEAASKSGEYRVLKKEWSEMIGNRPPFEEYISKWQSVYDETLNNHPLFEKPSPDCIRCDGTGIYTQTDNPKGRYESCHLIPATGVPVGPIHRPFEMDECIIKAGDIKPKQVPCIIIKPDGRWECEEYDPERPWPFTREWVEDALLIFKEYSEYWAVFSRYPGKYLAHI